jgi:hypothetical protein
MKRLRALLMLAVFSGLAVPEASAASSTVDFLRKIDRQLCIKFPNLKCKYRKQHAAEMRKAKNKVVTTAEPSGVVESQPASESDASETTKVATILPRLKPVEASKPKAPSPPLRATIPVVLRKSPEKPVAAIVEKKSLDGSCLSALTVQGVEFETVAQPSSSAACRVPQPVRLKSVRMNGMDVQLPDHPILNCAFARRFVNWLKEQAGPAATATEGFALTEFYTGPGFQCRGRNGDHSGKISEHGRGNAIDVERMKFSDGQVFLVHDALASSSKAYGTLKAMRKSACTSFSTVLGPGSNAAHREHFHFDAGMHGKSASYRICE